MSAPRVVAVAPGSPAARAGLQPGDEIVAMDGQVPRDIIEYQLLADQTELDLDVRRGGLERSVRLARADAEPLGLELNAALFDRVRTCDNHCEFCFIHQLPKGLRRSLYTRDDDYRLSFLYGNFTTLTRFTEADLERVVTEGLSPLWVSIHATDPGVRARMLRNGRGAVSLRWLRALLDHGVEVHGQVVVCPGQNDGPVLEDTLTGILDRYPELASVACVPLGVSRFNVEASMRPHSRTEAAAVVDLVEDWQATFQESLGRHLVYAADEYYLLSGRSLPLLATYGSIAQHDNGVGMARAFEARFHGHHGAPAGGPGGFLPVRGRRPGERLPAPRAPGRSRCGPAGGARHVLTGTYGAPVLRPLLAEVAPEAEVLAVPNGFFGGNIGVAGLLTGADLAAVLADAAIGRRYLLPDVCLSGGRFLDGLGPEDLPRPVEVIAADGAALRAALSR